MKPIFSYNADIEKNAYLNWRTGQHEHIHNLIVIADGFMKSATLLSEKCLEENWDKKADIVIFPILTNANHAIELYLKATMWTLNLLLKNNYRLEKHHNISQLFSVVCSRVNEFEKEIEKRREFKKQTENIKDYIIELKAKITPKEMKSNNDNMDFSRYPFTNDNVPHFYITDFDNVVVDLENFLLRFKDIGDTLKRISEYYLYDYLEYEE